MATCPRPSPCSGLARPCVAPKTRRILQARAQRFGDQGRSIVDANMSVLKERIEQVKMHERLQRWCRGRGEGWNYQPGYDCKVKGNARASESLCIARLIAGTLGFTILSGTFCLCLVSLLAHLNL